MFKWPSTPSSSAPPSDIADYGELVAWKNGVVSRADLSKLMERLAENEYAQQGVPEEDESDERVVEALSEVGERERGCGGGYPFRVSREGHTLELKNGRNGDCHRRVIYKFLLLATRLNMKDARRHGGIDGTALFERLAADVAKEYLGDRSNSFVFGTGGGGQSFRGKVEELCKRMGDGNGFVNRGGSYRRKRDGGLDVVAWIDFSDRRPGKLITFGQCKTGTNSKKAMAELQPEGFCQKWLQSPPALTPVRMFFASEAMPTNEWYGRAVDSGLLFDRCRIVDYAHHASEEVMEEVARWTAEAATACGLTNE